MGADADVRAAWFAYLAATRPLRGNRYAAVEPWAWTQLMRALRGVSRP